MTYNMTFMETDLQPDHQTLPLECLINKQGFDEDGKAVTQWINTDIIK